MSANANLIVHAGGIRRTRQELAGLFTPPPTATWRPVPHAELVEALLAGLHRQGVEVVREDFCTLGRDDSKLLGTLDLRVHGLNTQDYGMGLGLRASNDKSVAIQLVAAARVFVCDNWAFSGSAGATFLRRKHTSRLNLRAVIPQAVDDFLERAGAFKLDVERMRETAIADGRAKEILHDAFATRAMPLRLFPIASNLYFDDEVQAEKFPDRTLWSLNNALTEVVKLLKPAPQAESGLRIGRLFGRLAARPTVEVQGAVEADWVI